ncbi:unnamed protein product (macronuclear) [Paramecium tetraurelia]|uniref:Protein kinase domain-containing protein n=1 Tax=Paramecium tetraurelia TaxID=5888 RepID=A0CBV8_PARTE|nr:uncharacterized protein GSPATT00037058001 [Paramecium tetraurelia]CAK68275.1 unnamed protein product [Paramecium tetraurelia]|eukprot:XP_001435672.1 hypothetical protein (macronuclear) [Paramecium tetraurelia strain d4-2]
MVYLVKVERVIVQAIDTKTNEKVTIKKVFQDRRYKNREHLIISELNHPCITMPKMFILNLMYAEDILLNLVMDYISETLSKEKRKFKITRTIPQSNTQDIQLPNAESHGLFSRHRHLSQRHQTSKHISKPYQSCTEICDLGSANRLMAGESNVAYIYSRFYRAQELIFGATEYSTAIDIWSIVIAEMLTEEPLFPGESATDQLVEIIKILGTPTIDQIKNKVSLNQVSSLGEGIWQVQARTSFYRFCQLKPLETLFHPYFDEIRQQGFGDGNTKLPNFFDFQKEELQIQPEIAHKLTQSWVKSD